MSSNLISVIIALTRGAPGGGTPIASTSVVVTDSSGVPQKAVVLNGTETPTPNAFTTSVAPGAGSVVAQDQDANGVAVGAPVTQAFTEAGTGLGATTGITVTPASAAAAVAAASLKPSNDGAAVGR